MLWVKLDDLGNLTVQADLAIEAYALRQWEKAYKTDEAKLIIETGRLFDMDMLLKAVGKDVEEFRRWLAKREESTLVPNAGADVS